jgi:hypothetical protein
LPPEPPFAELPLEPPLVDAPAELPPLAGVDASGSPSPPELQPEPKPKPVSATVAPSTHAARVVETKLVMSLPPETRTSASR